MSSESHLNSKAGFDYNENVNQNRDDDDDVLEQSDMTPLTEGSTSEEEVGWLGGIGADFRNIANSLKDAVPPTIGAIGDIATFVQRSALSVAAEIAQLERDSSDEEAGDLENSIRLPWEILIETESGHSAYRDDEELKASIMALSSNRATFLKPFSVKGSSGSPEEESNFVILDEPRINQIRRLLSIDENLAATHSVLSGRSDVKETVFWTNYFFNCEKVRREHFERVQSASIISTLSSPPEEAPCQEVDEGPPSEVHQSKAPTVEKANVSRTSSSNSLVPADDGSSSQVLDTSTDDDAASFVQVSSGAGIASAPCSLLSVEDLILVSKSMSHNKE